MHHRSLEAATLFESCNKKQAVKQTKNCYKPILQLYHLLCSFFLTLLLHYNHITKACFVSVHVDEG